MEVQGWDDLGLNVYGTGKEWGQGLRMLTELARACWGLYHRACLVEQDVEPEGTIAWRKKGAIISDERKTLDSL